MVLTATTRGRSLAGLSFRTRRSASIPSVQIVGWSRVIPRSVKEGAPPVCERAAERRRAAPERRVRVPPKGWSEVRRPQPERREQGLVTWSEAVDSAGVDWNWNRARSTMCCGHNVWPVCWRLPRATLDTTRLASSTPKPTPKTTPSPPLLYLLSWHFFRSYSFHTFSV